MTNHSIKALIVNLTEDGINCDKTNIREQIEDLFDDSDIVQVKEFNDEQSMFNLIYNSLGHPSKGITACNIWENKHFLYVGYFIDIVDLINTNNLINGDENCNEDNDDVLINKIKEEKKKFKTNIFGSQITTQHVASALVIIKNQLTYTVSENNIKTDTKPITIDSKREMINILETIFVKEAIIVKTNGSMDTYKYIMNPLENLMLTDPNYSSNYIYHEYEIYTHIMMIIVDVREKEEKLNEIATLLAGKPVRGDVFIAIYRKPEYDEHPPYITLNVEKLNAILNIRKKSTTYTTGLNRSERDYVNFEKLLELENLKHIEKPILLAEEIKGELLNIK